MGAEIRARTRFWCWHGCQIGGECPGHTLTAWFRNGRYYLAQDEQPYREAVSLDANLLDVLVNALAHSCLCAEADGMAVYSARCPNPYHAEKAQRHAALNPLAVRGGEER
jgi:hypothetical protein